MPTKDELTKRAEDAGLEVDGRWSKETLIEAMQHAGIDTSDGKPKTVPILLRKDVWGDDDARHAAGSVVDWPVDAARRLIAAGKAERADPMPGEG